MFLAFTVVRTANANFKVIVHSNLVGGHYKLGELGIHCGKTTISTFKMLMHSNLEWEYFELVELSIHCGKAAISNFKLLMHSNLVGAQYNFHCQSTFQTFQAFL